MKRSTKIGLVLVGLVTLLEAAGFAGRYFTYSSHYVTTNNAQVDGDKVDIDAPISGTLVRWSISQGSLVSPNEVVGQVAAPGGGPRAEQAVRAPGRGTVAIDYAVSGQYVTAGTELATAYDFNRIYVTARVDENDIKDVHLGQPVDISVDAFPHAVISGVVTRIQASSAGAFQVFPGPDTDPTNPQKVTQYIPVTIAFTNLGGAAVAPGMNATVHIAKR